MIEKRQPVAVKEAVERVMKYAKPGTQEVVTIEESYGRYLAEDLIATHNVPPFDRSPLDGFAIIAEDTIEANSHNPIELEVVDCIGAGAVSKSLERGQAVRIMTGAQMPEGSNAVIMLELTKEVVKNDKTYVVIKRRLHPGDNISFEGEDTQIGALLAKKGDIINPGIKALLATFGYSRVHVAKKPIVGLFATGTELLDVNEELVPGKIRNSNAHMITAQIERVGAIPKYFGKLADDFEACHEAVKEAIDKVDILITTGGVSVGDYDYLPAIYDKLGATVLFNKIAMRPGSVTTVAQKDGKLLFGLSGNPSACYVGFELYARPVIRTMMYSSMPHLKNTKAVLQVDYPKPNPFTRFVRSALSYDNGMITIQPSGFDKSNAVSSLAKANALMVLPGGTRGYEKGAIVDVLLLEDNEGSEWPW
ncbi:molybdopterin molybdenumtransferase MoeA [Bacillus sp. HMF5848]|uniref:molybdopterin molybdotransferase MoeA n=1 Tax=Bacillus sp. HMF5848 TaxID=2495421 RepID=UPI000F79A38C|nr:gephyrin-like molybdotransferase Glp [Bacillus sp. HMF5848]RSK27945.1 molybdopterin molybdenumtransferase MoeA [Bacillus sp. HMF5848]